MADQWNEYTSGMEEGEEDIPKLLHSSFEKEQFQDCVKCDKSLPEANFYEIQKVFKHGKTILEHAICRQCGLKMVEDTYSSESRKRMQSFLSEVAIYEGSLKECHHCDSAVNKGKEHMVSALCRDQQLFLPPMVMCLDCMEKVQEQLSSETRDGWERFIEENIPSLPAKDPVPETPMISV